MHLGHKEKNKNKCEKWLISIDLGEKMLKAGLIDYIRENHPEMPSHAYIFVRRKWIVEEDPRACNLKADKWYSITIRVDGLL